MVTTEVFEITGALPRSVSGYFFARLRSQPPWTSDPILLRYRFTNAYRAADRVSQFLLRRVQPRRDRKDARCESCFSEPFSPSSLTAGDLDTAGINIGPLSLDTFTYSSYEGALSDG